MLDFADLKFRGISRPGLSLLNKGIFDVDKRLYFYCERPPSHVCRLYYHGRGIGNPALAPE